MRALIVLSLAVVAAGHSASGSGSGSESGSGSGNESFFSTPDGGDICPGYVIVETALPDPVLVTTKPFAYTVIADGVAGNAMAHCWNELPTSATVFVFQKTSDTHFKCLYYYNVNEITNAMVAKTDAAGTFHVVSKTAKMPFPGCLNHEGLPHVPVAKPQIYCDGVSVQVAPADTTWADTPKGCFSGDHKDDQWVEWRYRDINAPPYNAPIKCLHYNEQTKEGIKAMPFITYSSNIIVRGQSNIAEAFGGEPIGQCTSVTPSSSSDHAVVIGVSVTAAVVVAVGLVAIFKPQWLGLGATFVDGPTTNYAIMC